MSLSMVHMMAVRTWRPAAGMLAEHWSVHTQYPRQANNQVIPNALVFEWSNSLPVEQMPSTQIDSIRSGT